MKISYLLFLFLLFPYGLHAQMYFFEGRQTCCGDSLLTANYRSTGINPAYLGNANRWQTGGGILQLGGNFYAPSLSLSQLAEYSFTDNDLNTDIKQELIKQAIRNAEFLVRADLDLNWLAFSAASPGMGGFSFSLRDEIDHYGLITDQLFELLLLGQNSSLYQSAPSPSALYEAANGTNIYYTHIREASLGYGKAIISNEQLTLSVGAAFKYLWGIGHYRTQITGNQVTGRSSFSAFYDRINYGSLGGAVNDLSRRLLGSSGRGTAVDLGVSLQMPGRITFGASLIDIGQISWNKNTLQTDASFDSFVDNLQTGLIDSYNFEEELGSLYDQFGFAQGTTFGTQLNTQLRLIAAYTVSKNLSFNTDILLPLQQESIELIDYQPATYAAIANWKILPGIVNFNLSSGLLYSELYDLRVPLGISVEFGGNAMSSIAIPDITTYIFNRDDPYAGLSVASLSLLF